MIIKFSLILLNKVFNFILIMLIEIDGVFLLYYVIIQIKTKIIITYQNHNQNHDQNYNWTQDKNVDHWIYIKSMKFVAITHLYGRKVIPKIERRFHGD